MGSLTPKRGNAEAAEQMKPLSAPPSTPMIQFTCRVPTAPLRSPAALLFLRDQKVLLCLLTRLPMVQPTDLEASELMVDT